MRRVAIATALALAITIPTARPARADAAHDAKLAEAQELFRRGVALSEAEAYDRALDFFLRSRALVPSGPNTIGAASCLDRLGRYDEALEMAEEVVAKYSGTLNAENRADLGQRLARLRKKVGSLSVTSDVDATLMVDGRARGRVPLASPLRLLAGRHEIRVVKPGFAPYTQTIVAVPGVLVSIEAHLAMLPGAGVLLVEDASLEGASVFVDGARVGTVPWEGTMSAGPHVVRTEGGDRGSAPTEILVVAGQTSLARPASRELGAVLNLSVEPLTATLSIDGVFVARGRWTGRLPKGPHEVTAAEPGYRTRRATVNDGLAPQVRRFNLRVDPEDPHWPHSSPGRFVVSGFAGVAFSGSLHSGAASKVASDATYLGPTGGVRLGFRFPIGVAPELTIGYLTLRGSFDRTEPGVFLVGRRVESTVYHLTDSLWFRGPFAAAGASLTRTVGRVRVTSRVSAGGMAVHISDPVIGFVARPTKAPRPGPPIVKLSFAKCAPHMSDCADVGVDGAGEVVGGFPPFVATEVGAAYPFKSFDIGLAFGAIVFPQPGRTYTGRNIQVGDCRDARGLGCVSASPVIAREATYGPFVLWLPQVFATFPF